MSAERADWSSRAACWDVDPELFFPVGTSSRYDDQHAAARAMCTECPVRPDCLAFALATGASDGIWGGLTPGERRRLARHRTTPSAPQMRGSTFRAAWAVQ